MNPEQHLRAFVDSFIAPERREGWVDSILRKPSKAGPQFRKAERHLDRRFCTLTENPEESVRELARVTGLSQCVVCDGVTTAVVGIDHALQKWRSDSNDAILSLVPGELAVFVFHEGWGWICRRS